MCPSESGGGSAVVNNSPNLEPEAHRGGNISWSQRLAARAPPSTLPWARTRKRLCALLDEGRSLHKGFRLPHAQYDKVHKFAINHSTLEARDTPSKGNGETVDGFHQVMYKLVHHPDHGTGSVGYRKGLAMATAFILDWLQQSGRERTKGESRRKRIKREEEADEEDESDDPDMPYMGNKQQCGGGPDESSDMAGPWPSLASSPDSESVASSGQAEAGYLCGGGTSSSHLSGTV